MATAIYPGHLSPSNPWRAEPSFALARPPLVDDKVGVLICNLGTTVSPKPRDVARFLKEFLSDPRVVEIYPSVWQTVLNGLIIPLRKYTSGRLYARLFATVASSQGESPLTYYTRRFADRLGQELGSNYHVTIGMRYVQECGDLGDSLIQERCAIAISSYILLPSIGCNHPAHAL